MSSERAFRTSPRVLLADDDLSSRLVTTKLLEALGAECIAVGNGADAVEAANASAFNLILMDMQMPVMDGIKAAQTIRAASLRNADVPIIALTANTPEQASAETGSDAFTDQLTKPCSAMTLETVLREYADAMTGAPSPSAAPESRQDASDIFDPERVEELTDMLDADGARQIIEECVVEAVALYEELARAHEREGEKTVKAVAHKLKGAASSGGARLLAAAAADLEDALIAGHASKTHLTAGEQALQKTTEAAGRLTQNIA